MSAEANRSLLEDEDNYYLTLFVNGKKVQINDADPEWTLLYYLRNKLRLTGTKLGCGEGGCGACTVMVSKYDRRKNIIRHLAVNSCLAPLCSLHGTAITTVEGIGSTKTKLHPVQERIAKSHGSQCGFCTPGIVISMYTLLRNNPKPTIEELEVAFQGNLCRCTGYRPIIEGYKSFTNECGMGENCCRLQNNSKQQLVDSHEFSPYDPTQEPIFPPELKLSDKYDRQFLKFKGKHITWLRPRQLSELLQLKKQQPEAKLLAGNTEIGVEVKFKDMSYPALIHCSQVEELLEITADDVRGLTVGAAVNLLDLEDALKHEISRLPEYKTRVFKALLSNLFLFGSKQIRSVATVGGNIVTGSPISDIIPVLMAAEATLHVQSLSRGKRLIVLDQNFYKGYRKPDLKHDEILVALKIPLTTKLQYCQAYKQSKRRDDDIAIVNFCINVSFQPQATTIKDVNITFGGMSFKVVQATQTQNMLRGLTWNRQTLDLTFNSLLQEFALEPDAPGGMVPYRQTLSLSLFFKAFLAISAELYLNLDSNELSAIKDFEAKPYKSAQYGVFIENSTKSEAVHKPIVHASAYKQATGEAIFCDDLPNVENQLHLAFVLSTHANARILHIDPSTALAMDGVHCFVSAQDVDDEKNQTGLVTNDEKFFYSDRVTSQGQIIGAVVAIDQNLARKAAKTVKIEYEDIEPVILTIQDAIAHASFFEGRDRIMVKGDIDRVLKEAPHVLEGECKSGGQEHFYLETIAALVIPKAEDNELEVLCTSQNATGVACLLSGVLGIDQNKIVVKVKRLGGGFGGKDVKPGLVVAPAAVAAVKLGRPVRCCLDRDEDIGMTGGRHPFWTQYKVAFDNDGKILGIDVKTYMNAGYSLDYSAEVLETAMTNVENSYDVGAIRVQGIICKTNLPSNTAFRGFGRPQIMLVAETYIQDIADYLHKDIVEIIRLNLSKKGYQTHFHQVLTEMNVDRCLAQCVTSSNYNRRSKLVEEFNSKNRYKKRGINLVTCKYGVGFGPQFLNQGAAFVMVYTDGSVLLSHGGVEMGQGLHTKMYQVASTVLEIPIGKIHTVDTAVDKVPNTISTAASLSSDLYGMAVMDACKTIKARLEPYKRANPDGIWEEWVKAAYMDRTSLSATGFYKVPDVGYDWNTGQGLYYNYYTYGVACSEVEIDTLTGAHQVLRVDIVMDIGRSLNPAIDVGQIEGGFMQGYGLFVLEELFTTPKGAILTRGPGTYKLPSFGDVPGEFNVSLLEGSSNPRAVYSSRAVGEPPLFLGCSVFFAIKNAIKAARRENGVTARFKLEAPATCERIRMACQDDIMAKVKVSDPATYKPWSVYF